MKRAERARKTVDVSYLCCGRFPRPPAIAGSKTDGSEHDLIAGVEEMCAALGVPLPEAVMFSTVAVDMLGAWGKQYVGAFGPAQDGAGVCGIGSEV